jgi:hypothetical protein
MVQTGVDPWTSGCCQTLCYALSPIRLGTPQVLLEFRLRSPSRTARVGLGGSSCANTVKGVVRRTWLSEPGLGCTTLSDTLVYTCSSFCLTT